MPVPLPFPSLFQSTVLRYGDIAEDSLASSYPSKNCYILHSLFVRMPLCSIQKQHTCSKQAVKVVFLPCSSTLVLIVLWPQQSAQHANMHACTFSTELSSARLEGQ